MTTTYNGWVSYETWCVNTWLTNSSVTDRYWRRRCRELLEQPCDQPGEVEHLNKVACDLACIIEEELAYDMPDVQGMWYDLLRSSMERCDWREIAQHIVDDVASEMDWSRSDDE